MFKAKNNLSPVMAKGIWPESCNPYNLTYRGPKTWALIQEDQKSAYHLQNLNAILVNGNRWGVRADYAKRTFLKWDLFNFYLTIYFQTIIK